MLPAPHRMRRRDEFALTVRRGARAGSRHVVAHLLVAAADAETPQANEPPAERRSARMGPSPVEARVGFVVSKAVGGAVVRTRVKRRLRALLADRLGQLPAGSLLVVRANPAAAQASSAELARSVDRVLERVLPQPRPARTS
ncbi:MAG TPA: ribonuclease P protein component [Marmoricola sp.]|nr:ribonuclease P protein component [Marmoricola sp.]